MKYAVKMRLAVWLLRWRTYYDEKTDVGGLSIFDLIKVNFVITRRSYNEENPEISFI